MPIDVHLLCIFSALAIVIKAVLPYHGMLVIHRRLSIKSIHIVYLSQLGPGDGKTREDPEILQTC